MHDAEVSEVMCELAADYWPGMRVITAPDVETVRAEEGGEHV